MKGGCGLVWCFLVYSALAFTVRPRVRHRGPYSCSLRTVDGPPFPSPHQAPFDLSIAVALAGYSFDAYKGSRFVGKPALGIDGTTITYTSTDLIRKAFSGVILGTLLRGEIGEFEEQLMERVVSGSAEPDCYVDVFVNESSSKNQRRVVDSYRSRVPSPASRRPLWNESFSIYVESCSPKSSVVLNAYDKDMLKRDDLIGVGSLPMRSLLRGRTGQVPIALYLSNAKAGWLWRTFVRRKRMGTLFADLRYVSFGTPGGGPGDGDAAAGQAENVQAADSPLRNLPSGATPGMTWVDLLSRVINREPNRTPASQSPPSPSPSLPSAAEDNQGGLLSSLREDSMVQIATLENLDSDTQSTLWADFKNRRVILSFRGTEQIKVKDVITDIQLSQSEVFPWAGAAGYPAEVLREVRAHSGFLQAFRSVQPALLQVLSSVLKEEGDVNGPGWSIYITGHSLGGALATLLSLELARLQQGHWRRDDALDPASPYTCDEAFMQSLGKASIITYSFGAPRVGCPAFARLHDLLCPHTWRVVNDLDLVARMPRSSRINRLLEYEHAGRTVLISEAASSLWVEGESPGTCPLRDLSPFSTPQPPSSSSPSEPATSSPLHQLAEAAGMGPEGVDKLPALYASRYTFDGAFVEREVALLQSLIDGRGLLHHLEPSYFAALSKQSEVEKEGPVNGASKLLTLVAHTI